MIKVFSFSVAYGAYPDMLQDLHVGGMIEAGLIDPFGFDVYKDIMEDHNIGIVAEIHQPSTIGMD